MAIDPSDISLEEGPSKGRYVYRVGEDEAFMTFSKAGDASDHHRPYRGAGGVPRQRRRAWRWSSAGVADARAAGKKILPLCPFAAAQFRRHAEWADVLEGRKEPQS